MGVTLVNVQMVGLFAKSVRGYSDLLTLQRLAVANNSSTNGNNLFSLNEFGQHSVLSSDNTADATEALCWARSQVK